MRVRNDSIVVGAAALLPLLFECFFKKHRDFSATTTMSNSRAQKKPREIDRNVETGLKSNENHKNRMLLGSAGGRPKLSLLTSFNEKFLTP